MAPPTGNSRISFRHYEPRNSQTQFCYRIRMLPAENTTTADENHAANQARAHQRLLRAALLLLAAIGIGAKAYVLLELKSSQMCGADFPVFYAGGQLVGHASLYSPEAVQEAQRAEMGCTSQFAVPIRLPYFFALMKPWSLLPFSTSFWLWRVALIAAIGIFIWLWPVPRLGSLVVCAWSLPLNYCLINGQDAAFLLLWIAIGVALMQKQRDFAAGCAFAMCTAKFHLFTLLPVFLLFRKKAAAGWAASLLVLLSLCFAIQGLDWPAQFLSAIGHNIDPRPAMLPNIRAMAHSKIWLEALLAVCVLAMCLYTIRKGDYRYGLSAALTGGVLLSHHMVESDAALLIPAALLLTCLPGARYSKLIAVVFVSPVGSMLVATGQVLLLIALVIAMFFEVRLESGKKRAAPDSNAATAQLPRAATRPVS